MAKITDKHIAVRDRFRALHPDVVSIGFRLYQGDELALCVYYYKDEVFPDEFEGFRVITRRSGPGVLCV